MATQQNLLVIDLETRPETAILPADRDPDAWPKPIQQEIITLGFLLARIERHADSERYTLRKLGSASIAERSEREMLAGFWQMVDKQQPRIVTWNGRGFDAAVLKQRSLIHGLSAYNWHRTDPRFGYDYRFQYNWHCDLMDVLSDFGAAPRLGLDETAQALGLPGKWNGQGADVLHQAQAGDYAAINRYCEGDVLNTYLIYLRWAYFTTKTNAAAYNYSVQNLQNYLEAGRNKHPHWGEFLEHWQASSRPCPALLPDITDNFPEHTATTHVRSEDILP